MNQHVVHTIAISESTHNEWYRSVHSSPFGVPTTYDPRERSRMQKYSMDSRESGPPHGEEPLSTPPVPCAACEAALQSPEQQYLSFLLLDQFTIPVAGCEEHLEQFASTCGYTTDYTAELIAHRPAGGISCPSCHLAPYNLHHPVIPVGTGAVSILACPEHQSEIINRFQAGLDTQQQITTSLQTSEMR